MVKASYNLSDWEILAQNFSIGFKSGEYGGKKITSQPTDSIAKAV